MAANLALLNARRLRDPSKSACLLGELSNLKANVAAVQETHFTCAADCWVLEDDYVIHSAYVIYRFDLNEFPRLLFVISFP